MNGQSVYRPNALTGDPNHLGIMLEIPLLALTPVYLRLERGHRLKWPLGGVLAFLLVVELATLSRSGLLGLGVGLLVLALPYRRFAWSRALLIPLGIVAAVLLYVVYSRWHYFSVVLRSRIQTGGASTSTHFAVYDFIPKILHSHPLLGLGLNNFSVYYEFVTGKTNWGPHSFYVSLIVETGIVGFAALHGVPALSVRAAARGARARADARRGARPARPARAAACVGLHRCARRNTRGELLLPDDAVLLLLRIRGACARAADRVCEARRLKVAVLTTSFPRGPEDPAGRFVADAVDGVRARGVEVAVVSPASFRHFGIAYGHGIVGNLRAAPWRVLLVPAFLAAFRRAAARAADGADLVHAHWLAAGAVAATLGKPYVVQVWGTDVELARRAPWLARPVLARARLVLAASTALAEDARRLGAREVRVVPSGVAIPDAVGAPDEPPHVLYVGRLSAEKGVLELVEAAAGLPLVVAGDGPLRAQVPGAAGFVPPAELGRWYERAAVVAAPSLREGYGVAPREAMAWGRPVVASRVGGLVDAVEDGVTGLLVPPGDVAALRAALQQLLGDAELRARLGAAAREKAQRELSSAVAAERLEAVYAEALA